MCLHRRDQKGRERESSLFACIVQSQCYASINKTQIFINIHKTAALRRIFPRGRLSV